MTFSTRMPSGTEPTRRSDGRFVSVVRRGRRALLWTLAVGAMLALGAFAVVAQEAVPPAPPDTTTTSPALTPAPIERDLAPAPQPVESTTAPAPAPATRNASRPVERPVHAATTPAATTTAAGTADGPDLSAPVAPAVVAPQDPGPPPVPPADHADLEGWVAYKRAAHVAALPDQARLFYRRGLIAARAGQRQEALRMVRGASDLDPGFITPHLTLASWSVLRDPSQTLVHYGMALDIVRNSFLLQIELVANLAFFFMHALFVGLIGIALAIVVLRHAELRHLWQERIARVLSPGSARVWAWALVILPFVCGLGLALPAVVLLGFIWPVLRSRERTIHALLVMTLVAAPLASGVLGRLAAPLRFDEGPLYGIPELQDASWSPGRNEELATLAAEHPDNAVVQFGLAWTARAGGDLATAEAAYRRAMELSPKNDRVLNNLANVMVTQGRLAEAATLYRKAIDVEPENAAAYFNIAQVYTRQFEYKAASDAMARASAIDFELVKAQQALGTDDGVAPLADQWLSPAVLWRIVLDTSDQAGAGPATPASWRGHIESTGWTFSALVLVLALGSLMMGLRFQRSAALRPCHNCGRIVCRRCAQRRRELALCPGCAGAAGRAESSEFTKVLLARRRGAVERSHRLLRTTLATLIPGFGLLAFHRAFRALFLAVGVVLLTAPWLGVRAPFTFQSPAGAGTVVSPVLIMACWIGLYAISILGYLSQAAREAERAAALAAPVRSRPSQGGAAPAKAA